MKSWIVSMLLVISPCYSAFGIEQGLVHKDRDSIQYMTLEQVISRSCEHSIDGMMARHSFFESYWEFRSYKAKLLPSLSLSGSIPSFDRSISNLQDPNTGEFKYFQNYTMRNDLGLSLTQNLGFSGGKISLFTGLERLDQFSPSRVLNYNSVPVSLILEQPIGQFNPLRWEKRIEPIKYEQAKFIYLESMAKVVNQAVDYFFNQLIEQQNLAISLKNYSNTDTLYKISKERFKIGAISKSDLMQLELRLLNEAIAINENRLNHDIAVANLKSFLRYNPDDLIELIVPSLLPGVEIDLQTAYRLAMENTSANYRRQIMQLEVERDLAQTKAARNPQATVSMQFGLNQVGNNFASAYKNPLDQEVIKLGISVPIFDGGVNKGRVRMALSKQDVTEAQIIKDLIDQKQDIYLKVMQFNNQSVQCRISYNADSIAQLRYDLSMAQFAQGTLSVMELNNAQTERNQAHSRLITELYNFWNYYYTIQRQTLFDFKDDRNISTDFDQLVKKQ